MGLCSILQFLTPEVSETSGGCVVVLHGGERGVASVGQVAEVVGERLEPVGPFHRVDAREVVHLAVPPETKHLDQYLCNVNHCKKLSR